MSEVKGNLGSTSPSEAATPSNSTAPNTNIANTKTPERPLQATAQALHPLAKPEPEQLKPTTPATSAQSKSAPSAQPTKPTEQPKPAIQFNSTTGSKTAQKIDPFAEQNAKAAEKKQKQNKTKKRTIIIASIIGGLVLVGLGAWLILFLVLPHDSEIDNPSDDSVTIFEPEKITENIAKLQALATDAYKPSVTVNDGKISISGDLEAANRIFDDTISDPQNRDYIDQINLSKAAFYFNNGMSEQALQVLLSIDLNKLGTEQHAAYYNIMSMIYYSMGNYEKSKEYANLAREENYKLPEEFQIGG